MNQVILLIVQMASLWIGGVAFSNEQYNLLDPSQVLYESKQIKFKFALVGDWSIALAQEQIDLPTINDMVELPELSLKTQHLYAQSDPAKEAEGLSQTADKVKLKKKKPAEDEFTNLPFKQPNEYKPWRKPLGWSFVGLGSASILAGTGCLIGMLMTQNEPSTGGRDTSADDARQSKIDNLKIATIVLGSAGAVILITGVALLLWEEYAPIKTEVDVGPGYAGMSIKGVF
jgi:hypothetical protein